MKKFSWVVPVLVALTLFGLFIVRPWYRDRQASAAAEALIGDLKAHGEQAVNEADSVPAIPEPPTIANLQAQRILLVEHLRKVSEKFDELRQRAEETLPKTPEPKRQELRDAISQYVANIHKSQERNKEHREEIRVKLQALTAAKGKA